MFQIYFTTQPIDFWDFSFSVVKKQVSKRLSIDTLSLRLVYTCYSFFNCCKRFDKTLQVHLYNRTQYVDVNIIKQILIPWFFFENCIPLEFRICGLQNNSCSYLHDLFSCWYFAINDFHWVEMKNDNNKLSSISKIHMAKFNFKAEQHGAL